MQIVRFDSYIVRVPLRKEFKHASHTRKYSDNVLICCRLADGTEGWGEGVPRPYVTGEMPEGALRQMAATPWAEQVDADCRSWNDVIEVCQRLAPTVQEEDLRGCKANSLHCAVELSVLDAYGRLFGEPVSEAVSFFSPAEAILTRNSHVRYAGGVTATGPLKVRTSSLKMRLFGFKHCKVKVGVDGADDRTRLAIIRSWVGPKMDLRLDANEAWSGAQVVAKVEPLLPYRITSLEQPVPHREVASLRDVRRQLPVPIMLDESLTSLVDAEDAIGGETCDLFNIRLSKCGGLLSSLRLAAKAHAAGLGYQLGCHPGETGILSAAGRHFATRVSGLRYVEGSYDRFLLRENLVNEDITFGYGGRAPALSSPGLGVSVNRQLLARITRDHQQHPLM